MFERLTEAGWAVRDINYGNVIAQKVFGSQFTILTNLLVNWSLDVENSIIKRGGGQADQTSELTDLFVENGWKKNRITVENRINFENFYSERTSDSTSHEIDHIIESDNGELAAFEIEWNNKDEFFDRDFQAMRRLYELNVIDLGVILTRGPALEDQFKDIVANYFQKHQVNDIENFSDLRARFTDERGNERFSFPTESQKRKILAKLRANSNFHQAAASVFVSDKFAGTTTNWRQLQKRIERRDAGRTPLIFLGIPPINF